MHHHLLVISYVCIIKYISILFKEESTIESISSSFTPTYPHFTKHVQYSLKHVAYFYEGV